jgi:hypothetical protein
VSGPEGRPDRPTGWEALDRWVRPPEGEAGAGGPSSPPRCSACGARLEDDQTYCLECGAPTPLAPRFSRPNRAGLALAVALVLLGLGAGALAYAVAQDDSTSGAAVTDTTPGVPLPSDTTTFGTLPSDTTGGLPSDTTGTGATGTGGSPVVPPVETSFGTTTSGGTTATAPPGTGSTGTGSTPTPSGASDWPAGTTAWTVQLSSVRVESAARTIRDQARARGDTAGVLFSSSFDELEPGYYVVFSGTFDSRAEAISRASALRARYPGAFARRLSG